MTNEKVQGLTIEDIFPADRILKDVDRRGKDRDWRGRKMRNELLATAYHDIDRQKEARLRECGKVLTFKVYEDGTKILDSLNSCRVRLCPICSWRRSLKIYAQTREIVEAIANKYGYRWVMLTLTCKTVDGEHLSSCLDNLLRGWSRLTNLKAVEAVCKGWYRSLEITHDCYPTITPEMWNGDPARHIKARGKWYSAHGYHIGDVNPNYDMYHPHIHALIAVSPGYFKGGNYIRQSVWTELWREALRVDYSPRVDIRSVKGETMEEINRAVCEVSKYAAKDSDYIVPDDWDLTVETVRILNTALASRRLVAYGGVMRDIKRALKQDDIESGDLVHVGDNPDTPTDQTYRLVSYWWYTGYRQYGEISNN